MPMIPSTAYADAQNVAEIDGTEYSTLAKAIDEAEDGDTVRLLRDAEGSGVKVNGDSGRHITIDFCGHTYTVVNPTVGSSGTETNGFQLLKGSIITFRNGTVKPGTDSAKILLQNYCNLTLDNMVVDCSENPNCQYASSNNCGNVVIRNSKIVVAQGQAAFDVYYWPSNGYGEGVSVAVEGDSHIEGRVEYGSDGTNDGKQNIAEKASLNIKSGTFVGSIKTSGLDVDEGTGIVITGGTFLTAAGEKQDVSAYVQPGMMQDSDGDIVINDETAVAKIGDVGYDSLSAAIAAAQDEDVVTMLKEYDATSEGAITFDADKGIVLDLGGCKLTLSRFNLVQGRVTVKNGSVDCSGQAFNVYAAPTAESTNDYTKLVIEENVTINAAYGICLFPEPNSNAGYNSTIEVYGKIESGGIFVSGNLGNDAANAESMTNSGKIPSIYIYEGSVVNNGSEGQGIAMNGLAKVIVHGGTITGSEAVGVKRGTLAVEGGTFISNGEYVDPAEANNNGTENTGATISITGTYNYAGTISVILNGGTFTSKNAPAVYLGHSKKNTVSVPYTNGVTLDIGGGAFSSPDEISAVYVADKIAEDAESYTKRVVSGGTFSQDLSDSGYLADNVQYQVAHVAGGFSYVSTLDAALEMAQPGDSVTVVNATSEQTCRTLTLNYNDGGTTPDSKYIVETGTEVDLPTPMRAGYIFQGWRDESGSVVGTPYAVESDATLTAQWSSNPGLAPAPSDSHAVTVGEFANGKVAADPSKASEGDTVTLTVTPDEGFELAVISVVGPDGQAVELTANADGTYSFEMPAFGVEVKASFACDGGDLCPSHGFPDVDQGLWYHAAVDWAVEAGVLHGIGGTGLMMPDGDVTRAQMAAILWNVEGNPEVAYGGEFSDVAAGDWFEGAVAWAYSKGLFVGYEGSGCFGPDDALTREQAAAVLMRWSGMRGEDTSARADLSAFADASDVDAWAKECMSWAVAEGVLNGVERDDGSRELQPLGTATRAQAAALMMNLIEA